MPPKKKTVGNITSVVSEERPSRRVASKVAVSQADGSAETPPVAPAMHHAHAVHREAEVLVQPLTSNLDEPAHDAEPHAVYPTAEADLTLGLTAEERHRMIAEAAYYKFMQRGEVAPAHPDDDWLAAEAEVESVLARRHDDEDNRAHQ